MLGCYNIFVDLSCVDNVMGCQQLADNNLCTLDINVAQKKCPLTCGFCQPPLKTGNTIFFSYICLTFDSTNTLSMIRPFETKTFSM